MWWGGEGVCCRSGSVENVCREGVSVVRGCGGEVRV